MFATEYGILGKVYIGQVSPASTYPGNRSLPNIWPGLVAKTGGTGVKQQKADRRSQRTYHLGSSALVELLVEKPYEAILVQDILDRAGIGRTTFYAHFFDKEDVLTTLTEQMLETFTQQIAQTETRPRVVPSLELFHHVYHSQHQQFQLIMRGHAGDRLWEALQTALCRVIEPALTILCAEKRTPPIPLAVVAEFLADALLTLLKWWLAADMPYPPEQMERIFQQLALPGVWAILKEKPAGISTPA